MTASTRYGRVRATVRSSGGVKWSRQNSARYRSRESTPNRILSSHGSTEWSRRCLHRLPPGLKRVSVARLCHRIYDYYACSLEIAKVEGHNRQIVRQRSRGDEAVLDRHRASLRAECREQLSPAQSRRGIPWDALKPLYSVLEPAFEPASATTTWEQQNAETDLTQDDWVEGELGLIAPKPIDNALVRGGLGRLREDVRVNQIARQCDQAKASRLTRTQSLRTSRHPDTTAATRPNHGSAAALAG